MPKSSAYQHQEESHTHLACWAAGPSSAARSMVLLTAENKHSAQQMCPQGVKVAKVGGEKQMGQLYEERGSAFGRGTAGVSVDGSVRTRDATKIGEVGDPKARSSSESRCCCWDVDAVLSGASRSMISRIELARATAVLV